MKNWKFTWWINDGGEKKAHSPSLFRLQMIFLSDDDDNDVDDDDNDDDCFVCLRIFKSINFAL